MLSFYSGWGGLLVLTFAFGLAATPAFAGADAPPSSTRSRVGTLDGLRGFLALAVFLDHAARYHTYVVGATWGPSPSRLYELAGSVGVAIFFMITGFLFWGKLIEEQGRPNWIKLYVGRLFRIGPLYLVAIVLMLIGVALATGLRLHEAPLALAKALARWGSLGLSDNTPINGMAQPDVFLARVTWTLRWEWFFYASLFVTAVFARGPRTALALPAMALAVALAASAGIIRLHGISSAHAAFIALFCVGMLSAALKPTLARLNLDQLGFSIVAFVAIAAVLALYANAYAAAPILLLGVAFVLMSNGASLFGLLHHRAARRLGDISFGIYLLQGPVLAAIFASTLARRLDASSVGHWGLVFAAAVILLITATFAHGAIERPGIALGRKFSIFPVSLGRDRAQRKVPQLGHVETLLPDH